MLSVKSIGSGGGAAAYYEGLAREDEDYYTAGGEPPGQWVGEYAREIGLTGEVQKGELGAGFAGYHPRTGEAIANNAGDGHKAGYDLTFSAPKSVSVLWGAADADTRAAISAAQQRAVEKALDYASRNAFRQRSGHAGAIKIEHTSGVAFATFEHGTSRAGEVQIHTHALGMNLAENGKRIDFDTSWKMAAGAAYRAELSADLQKLGLSIERDGTSFKVLGVPDDLVRELSTRRQQIETAMREHNAAGGKAAAVAALDTRQVKGDVNRAELFERTRELAKEHGFDPAAIRSAAAIDPDKFDSRAFLSAACEQASTLTRQQLEKELFQAAQGSLTIAQAEAKLVDLKQRGELVELRDSQGAPNRWTTRDMLAIEQRIADTAERMALEKTHPVSQASLDAAMAAKSLSDDQKQALQHITLPERIAAVQGVAGAGKSYMLDAARAAWERDGYTVRGAALAGKAAEGLQESSGIESSTIHSMVYQLDLERIVLDNKTVIVLDEAGMIGSSLYDRLQQHIDAAGAKLVLVGDTQQLQPIDAGGAMRAVQERAGAVSMDEIRRQADPAQRQIVRDFKDGRAGEAIDRLEKLGQVKNYETAAEAKSGMASAIVRDMQEGKTSIGLAGTRAEVHQINQQARREAQQAGLVSREDHKFEAERGARQFADGDRVIFLKNDRELGVKNGSIGTVERAAEGNLIVKLDNGKTVELGEMKYRDIDHGYAMTVHKSQGVTVDRAHLMPGKMTDQHSAYVGASRHRETVQVHGTREQIETMRETAARAHTKDTSADQRYTPVIRQDTLIERAVSKLEQLKQAFTERVAAQEAEQPAKDAAQTEQPAEQPTKEADQQVREGEVPAEAPAKDAEQPQQVREMQEVEQPAKDAAQAEQPAEQPTKEADQQVREGEVPVEAPAKDAEQPQQVREMQEVEQPAKNPAQAEQLAQEVEQPAEAPAKDPDAAQIREGEEQTEQPAKDAAQAEQPAEQPTKEADQQVREGEVPAEAPAKDAEQPQQVREMQEAEQPAQEAEQPAQVEQPVEAPAKDPDTAQVKQAGQLKQPEQKHQEPKPKQAEQQKQLKAESTRHQQRQPEKQADQQKQLKAESARQRQPERQPEKQTERER